MPEGDRDTDGRELAGAGDGPVATPRPAATIVLVRDAEALEVLLVQRTPAARFMGSAWVFPGGAVDAADDPSGASAGTGEPGTGEPGTGEPGTGEPGTGNPGAGPGEAAFANAARRELDEEAGVALPPGHELIPYARWITPADLPIRFDTWFFLAIAPDGADVHVDGREIVDHRWMSPADALAAGRSGEIDLMFPTRRQLEQLCDFAAARELVDHFRGREVRAVQPRVVPGDQPRIALPGEPGYDD